MNKNLTKIYASSIICISLFSADHIHAIDRKSTLKNLLPGGDPTGYSLDSVGTFITNVTSYALDIAGVIAFIMILYASIMYLTSYGEESKAEIAKKTLMWSIIGILAVIFAKSVIMIVYNILNK